MRSKYLLGPHFKLFTGLSPEKFFLLLSSIISIALVLIIPPFQAPDERSHFLRTIQLSYGHVRAHKFSDRVVGELLPAKYDQTFSHYLPLLKDHQQKSKPSTVIHDINHADTNNTRVITTFENTAVYPPLAYIPQAIGVTFARILQAPVVIQLYAARLGSSVVWLMLCFLAIKRLPFGKWAATALTLTPLSYLLAASCSNDAIMFSLCLLFIATIINLRVTKTTNNKRQIVQALLLALLIGLCKQPYTLLVVLLFLVPQNLFDGRRKYLAYCLGGLAGALVLSSVWALAAKRSYIPTNIAADTGRQLHFIISNPLGAFVTFTNNLFFSPSGDFDISDFTGLMNWVGIRMPALFTIGDLIIIVLLLLIHSPQETSNTLKVRTRILLGCVALAGAYAISLLIYLSFEAVGTDKLIGLNSRYFTPFVFLLIPIFSSLELKSSKKYFQLLLACKFGLIVVGIATISLFVGRFYAV